MKKIKIIESTNLHLNEMNHHHLDLLNPEERKKLREYVLGNKDFQLSHEPTFFYEAMHWVHRQWDHHGINQAPAGSSTLDILKRAASGERFRCVEYASVTRDVLIAFGHPARSVNLLSIDADYGGTGKGHMGTEVWSNQLDKWIFLDPQFNCHAEKDGLPLSYLELVENHENVRFHIPSQETRDIYSSFISEYVGYVRTNRFAHGHSIRMTLPIQGSEQHLAFESMELDHASYTNNKGDFYPALNHTMILFEYKEKKDLPKLIQDYNIQTEEEYEAFLPLLSAKPDYRLTFIHTAEAFSHYEVSIDAGDAIVLYHNELVWSLVEGMNRITARTVNDCGVKGVPVTMTIYYGE
ncbi:transglutaminase-like domain-containing protein [Rossellomorea marisflavi]|uniref:transglutaminase-like domain-containing protein n=1 Tax=Rossellomorea marisflavi TaxID=189381 RepID=UPI001EE28A49|nr:transglutaminase-like domain-containing protein [Rossellomorea marisflavi]UKS66429.1 transglutaminase-like domain-containing protein [Rossellomorea marisflavi]